MYASLNKQLGLLVPWLSSLRARLFLLLFLAFLPVYSFIFYTVFEARMQAAENAIIDARSLTHQVALKQKTYIEFAQQQLINFAQLPIVRHPEMARLCNETFSKLLKLNPAYNNLGVIDRNGNLRCSALKANTQGNYADHRYFNETPDSPIFIISNYPSDSTTRKRATNLAYPIRDANRNTLAVVFITLDLSALTKKLIENTNLPPGSTLTIWDQRGTILARHPEPERWVGTTHPDSPMFRAMIAQNQEGTTETTGVDGIERLYVFNPFNSPATKQIYINAGIPTHAVYAEANKLLSRALLLMSLVSIAAVLLALFGSRIMLLQPISLLMNAVRRFGSGNLSVRTGMRHTPDEFGQMARVFDEMAQSIEEREKQQRASDARFANIVNLAGDAIISIDESQRIVAYNHTAMHIFGHPPEQMIGQSIDLLLPPDIVPAHRNFIKNFGHEADATRIMGGGREISGRHANGTIFPAEASISKFTEEGKTIYTVVLRDITDRKRTEKALHQKEELLSMVGEMAMVGGWEFDTRTHVGSWTEEVARIHETDPKNPTGVESGIQYYCEGSRQLIEAAVKDAIEKGKPYDLELEITTAKGNHKWVRTIGQAVKENGVITKVWGSFQDITKQKQAADEIFQLNLDLERRIAERTSELASANRELEAFSYSVSHDLRAPLRAIDGFSQALLEDYSALLDNQGKDYINRVRNATQRMATLIDDLLTLSRMSRAELHRVPVDLSAMAAEILAEFQKTEPARKVSWHITPGLTAQCDPHLMKVVLDNLLGNAWKFTGKTASAEIEFTVVKNADGEAEYIVRDNGAGFDMNYAGKLFTPFQRMHLTADFPGTGIGLATVQRIIRRHGGTIRAEAAPDLGAAFCFTLPECLPSYPANGR